MRQEVHREIARLMTHMRRFCSMALNKRLSLVGSSLHEYSVLFRLAAEVEVPQHELAFDAAIDPAAASRLVRDMGHHGLLTTRVDPGDKRQRFVRITAKGRILEETLTPVVDAALEPYMVGLTLAEEDEFVRLLRKAHAAVVEAHAQGEAAEPKVPVSNAPRLRGPASAKASLSLRSRAEPRAATSARAPRVATATARTRAPARKR